MIAPNILCTPRMKMEKTVKKLECAGLRVEKQNNLYLRLIVPGYILYDVGCAVSGWQKKHLERTPSYFGTNPTYVSQNRIHALGKLVTSLVGSFLWTAATIFFVGLCSHLSAAVAFTAVLHALSLPTTTVILGALGTTPIGLIIIGSVLLLGLTIAFGIGLYHQISIRNMTKDYLENCQCQGRKDLTINSGVDCNDESIYQTEQNSKSASDAEESTSVSDCINSDSENMKFTEMFC